MEDEQTPAGEVHTEDTAVSLIQSMLTPEEEKQPPAQEAETHQAEAQAPEPETEQPAAEADPVQPPDEEDVYVHGNAKTRLRDGREIRVSELKRLADIEPELRQRQERLQSERQQIEAAKAQIAQQYQFVQTALPNIVQVMKAQTPALPDPPTPELAATDPFKFAEEMGKYVAAKDARDKHVVRLQQAEQQQQWQQAQAQQQQQRQYQAWVGEQKSKLLERAPEFKDQTKVQEFMQDAYKYGSEYYGIPQAEIANMSNHAYVLALKDAIAYRKLQERKPQVVAKAKEAPPVKEPGRRVSDAEKTNSALAEQRAKLRKSGRPEDAEAIILQMLG